MTTRLYLGSRLARGQLPGMIQYAPGKFMDAGLAAQKGLRPIAAPAGRPDATRSAPSPSRPAAATTPARIGFADVPAEIRRQIETATLEKYRETLYRKAATVGLDFGAVQRLLSD